MFDEHEPPSSILPYIKERIVCAILCQDSTNTLNNHCVLPQLFCRHMPMNLIFKLMGRDTLDFLVVLKRKTGGQTHTRARTHEGRAQMHSKVFN